MNLQEVLLRGRFIMANAPKRCEVFECVNGKRDSKEIAKITRRSLSAIDHDLKLLSDAELIIDTSEKNGNRAIFEKIPLARTIPIRYFKNPSNTNRKNNLPIENLTEKKIHNKDNKAGLLRIPNETDILEITKSGENQIYEFKGQGTNTRKITREVAAMLNTRQGGIIFYGIDDEGNIEGTDITQQALDQPLQNSVHNSISPSGIIHISTTQVLGTDIILILVPPWDKKNIYQFDEKYLIRKGTNVFALKPEELRQMHSGKCII
jgi:hypothetical protein